MADPTQQPQQASPTGTPLVSQSALRWILIVYASLGAANGAMAAVLGFDSRATQITFIVLAAIAPLIGVASPGLRKTPPG